MNTRNQGEGMLRLVGFGLIGGQQNYLRKLRFEDEHGRVAVWVVLAKIVQLQPVEVVGNLSAGLALSTKKGKAGLPLHHGARHAQKNDEYQLPHGHKMLAQRLQEARAELLRQKHQWVKWSRVFGVVQLCKNSAKRAAFYW